MDFIDRTNREYNNVLAILLQKKEAHCVLDVIMPKLKELGIIPLTIHDSFVCYRRQSDEVLGTIKDEMVKLLGIIPTLSIETLIEEETIEEPWSIDDEIDSSAA